MKQGMFDYIQGLPIPKTCEESLEQFRKLYEMVSIPVWYETDLVFDVGNYIMRYRPDLLALGIRLNVQVNLFLRTIEKYAEHPEEIFKKVGHKIGCFALTEEDAGVLSGLIVDTTWKEYDDKILLNSTGSSKNWISQGMLADYAIVYARNNYEKDQVRIFLIDMKETYVVKTPINDLDVNRTLDMAKLTFEETELPKSALLERSSNYSKMELLNGIFFGRYMIAEATISAMLGMVEHIHVSISTNEKTLSKFENLGFLNYLNKARKAFNDYKRHLYGQRNSVLKQHNLFLTNCYKIYTVEKSIALYNDLKMMFGMRVAKWKLSYDTLLLHKVAEGDTYVLRVSLINNHFKSGYSAMLSHPGFSFLDLFYLLKMKTKREKFAYIMDNFKRISNNLIHHYIPQLDLRWG